MAFRRLGSRRGMATLIERGINEFGPGGHSSVAGVTATVFGATGFLGRYLVFELGKTGYRCYIPNRGDEMDVRHLKVAFDAGQSQWVPYSPRDEDSIKRCMEGSDIVINLIGKYYETKHMIPKRLPNGSLSFVNYTYEEMNVDIPARLASIAKEMGIERFVHMSSLASDLDSPSVWAKTKAEGEIAVKDIFPEANIVRAGRLFGSEDRLLNWYAWVAGMFPAVPLVEGGKALIQPTYVCDVADAIVKIIEDEDWTGKDFDLAGDMNFTYKELLDFIFDVTYQNPRVVDLPAPVAEAIAMVSERLMNPVLVPEDVRLWQIDQVLDPAPGVLTFKDLQIKPTPIEKVAFNFLYRFRKGGHFPYASGFH